MNSFFEMNVDGLGRVTIPARVRRILGIDIHSKVVINFDNEKLEIRKKDANLINNSINNILNVTNNSEELTVSEYKQLEEILSKLEG